MEFIPLNKDKSPNVKEISPEYFQDNYNDLENAGLILGDDIIVLDFDGDNVNEDKICNFMLIIQL